MADILVRYQYDPTGRNPDNLIQGEAHSLTPVTGFPYKIVTMDNGGFYARNCRVYDSNYNRMVEGTDYILTYVYEHNSKMVGLKIVNDIVFLNKQLLGTIYVSAQIVGGDVAFSLTGITDYVEWYKKQPSGYVPKMFDYAGNEPDWQPGELDKERWRLDTYQPFNFELYQIARASEGGRGVGEDKFRKAVQDKYADFLGNFNTRLADHIKDTNNPHKDNKEMVGLTQLQNYKLATNEESVIGTANNLYQTPALSWATVKGAGLDPLNQHIANRSNPHRVTGASLDIPSKTTVNSTANSKYDVSETVVNTNYLMNGSTPIQVQQFINEARANIPPTNFISGGSNGYLNPARLGVGAGGAGTVLRSVNPPQWVSFNAMLQEFGVSSSATCYYMDFGAGVTADQAFAMAMQQPAAASAPMHSIIAYSINEPRMFATGGGLATFTNIVTNLAYKTPSGWVKI